jgi:sugar lactone lactonase YvrE
VNPRRLPPVPAVLLSAAVLAGCGPARVEQSPAGAPASASPERPAVSGREAEQIAAAYRDGTRAYAEQNFPAAAEAFARALEVNPGDEATIYLIAASHARAGDAPHAAERLRELAALGSDFIPRESTFAKIGDAVEYRKALEEILANARKVTRGEVAFTIPEKDLIPEGIAYDPVGKTFYVGSIYKRKIVAARPGAKGAPAETRDFTREGQEGPFGILGMKVDPGRRILWVASSARAGLQGTREEDLGKSAVLRYDLGTGRLIRKYPLDNTPSPHILNDVAFTPDGTLFVTDTLSGSVYRIPPEGDALEEFLPAGSFQAANGITASDDGTHLFVGSWEQGISMVDIATSSVTRLAHPAGISLNGPDGLAYFDGSLLAIQNSIGPGRLTRFFLDTTLQVVTRAEILDSNHPLYEVPTTGTIAEGAFYYIANSQTERIGEDGSLAATGKPREVIVLRTGLS